ncbi:MAG TPA: Eco57I restriction-modification methylase domain-containing protein, partial [Pirellulales bacterium]|nr:Eco57I restriction-modification methylase domain-containing protein [Pirellulales bacterium]
LTAGHQAKVEEKPEVAKAGGVYYTPAYIVDYLVKQTIGQRIAGRSPAQLAGLRNGKQPFRVLDMACGSGSFLLGAYQRLLDHCLSWYIENNPAANAKAVFKDPRTGEWRLTIGEKKRILTTHLFGVDIDPQAVEVSKLSLLLRALEGENDATLSLQLRLFPDRALPNLADNIKCGNSLIAPDYFTRKLLPSNEELKRVNPFDWQAAFPAAMANGGFDCVIGNPPYIRIQTMKEWAPLEVEIYKDLFQAGRNGNYDIYVIFIEQGLKLLNAQGTLGFICPHKFFNSQYGAALRGMIAAGKHLEHVVYFGAEQVFERATTYTCLLFLSKSPVAKCRFAKVDDLVAWRATGKSMAGNVGSKQITEGEWNFSVGAGAALFGKLSAMSHKLGDVADIFVGLQTSADDVFILDFVAETDRTYRLRSKVLDREWVFEKSLLRPLVSGTDVRRYGPLPNRQYILFPYRVENERATLIDFETIERQQPKAAAYLLENRQRLEERERGAFRDARWHRFGRSQNLGIQERVKLCVPRLVERLHAAYDHDGSHFLDNVDVGGVTLKAEFAGQGLDYLLALLNSRLMRWYFPQVSAPFRGGWRSANRQFLSRLPVRLLSDENKDDVAIARQLDELVSSMRDSHRRLAVARGETQRQMIDRQIDATDREIDAFIYRLYGVSDDEIAVVEGAK